MIVKLLTEHHLEFLSLKGGCRGLSESTHVKKQHCWKSHATIHIPLCILLNLCLGFDTIILGRFSLHFKGLQLSNFQIEVAVSLDCFYLRKQFRL